MLQARKQVVGGFPLLRHKGQPLTTIFLLGRYLLFDDLDYGKHQQSHLPWAIGRNFRLGLFENKRSSDSFYRVYSKELREVVDRLKFLDLPFAWEHLDLVRLRAKPLLSCID